METSLKHEELPCTMAHSAAEDQLPITTNVIAEVTNQLKSKLRCGPPNSGGVNGCCTAVLPPPPSHVKTGDCINGLQHCKSSYGCMESACAAVASDGSSYWSYSCDDSDHRGRCDVACFGECVPAALHHSDVKRSLVCSSMDSAVPACPVTASRTCVEDQSTTSTDHKGLSAAEPVIEVKSSPGILECECGVQEMCLSRASESELQYVAYESEHQMPEIMRLIQKDLSEPYSIYTYRYFIHNWPKLCFLAMDGKNCIGAIVCKLDMHKKMVKRGYIAMLAVDERYRKRKIGSNLVLKAIHAMIQNDADEVVLETEVTNKPALRLYENLGFVRDKRLFRYYLNGVDALRLKLWLR